MRTLYKIDFKKIPNDKFESFKLLLLEYVNLNNTHYDNNETLINNYKNINDYREIVFDDFYNIFNDKFLIITFKITLYVYLFIKLFVN